MSCLYRYEFQEMYLHWGQDGLSGSEHSVGQRFFPGELQILAFNADLYKNLSQAFGQPSGVVALAIMIKEAERGINSELSGLVKYAGKVGNDQRATPLITHDPWVREGGHTKNKPHIELSVSC